jgi:hypothetical protein
MPRTNADLVRGILKIKTSIDITPFISDASDLIDEVVATQVKSDGLTPYHTGARLTRIETWLAAHFVAVAYRRRIQEGVSGVQSTYEGKVDLNLDVTEYGQQAKILDTSGALAKYNNAITDAKGIIPVGIKRRAVYYLGERD